MLAQPQRWFFVALVNAIGTVAGVAVFAQLFEMRGEAWAKEQFPSVFTSSAWKTTEAYVQACVDKCRDPCRLALGSPMCRFHPPASCVRGLWGFPDACLH